MMSMAHLTTPADYTFSSSTSTSTSTSASASTSTCTCTSTSTSNSNYDVFINHRGPDVKKTFASHLYRRLLLHGFRVFLDQQVMQAGDRVISQIEGAIATASVHIAILSPRYAESKWCLDELLLMLKSGATIIPIFFNVKPSDLRWACQDGVYNQALRKHEEKRRYDSQALENWRKALSDVSSLSGFELEGCKGDEGELVDKVVQRVLKKREKGFLNVAKYPTGLNEKLEDLENTVLLQQRQQRGTALVVGIVGLGGVGKTTLVKELFNRKSSDYGGSCFLFDVREAAANCSLNSLQSKLLKDLIQLDRQIDSVAEGIEMLRTNLKSFHALVVLDNVDHVDQLDAFLSMNDTLRSDSLILVTSRDKHVLTSSGIGESSIYKLTGLNRQHSRELFCSSAFCHAYPLPGFEYLVDQFLTACGGLPLSLKVFGALLCGETDKSCWEDQLGRLQQVNLPTEIQRTLKISYDALNGEEKEIFLDIACFFIGEKTDMALRIWNGSGWKGSLGLRNLKDKCLVEVDSKNRLRMHDHLRDLGRDIVEQEKSSGLSHRLWRPARNITDLFQGSSVTTDVRGIMMAPRIDPFNMYTDLHLHSQISRNKSWSNKFFGNPLKKLHNRHNNMLDMRRLQLLIAEDCYLEGILRRVQSPNLIWLCWYKCPYSFLPSWIPTENLRVLEVVGTKFKTLWRHESQAPMKLQELNICAPLLKFPKSIGQLKLLEKIVVDYPPMWIYLKTSPEGSFHLKTLPEEFCDLQSLKHLELKRCSTMKSLPDSFGNLTNLEYIDLSESYSLEMLPNSFRNLIQLKHLCLQSCYKLTILRETLGNINTLEYLNLSDCPNMELLPPQVTQQSLEEIYLLGTSLKELPGAIGDLTNLESLELGSPFLEMLPHSLGYLKSLQKLGLYNCQELKYLPDSVGLLTKLTTLHIECCGICYLPSDIMKMNNLESLQVVDCPLQELPFTRALTQLDSIDKCMLQLKFLRLYNTHISEVSFHEGVCPNLQYLKITFCNDLVEVGALPTSLITLDLSSCYGLRRIQGLRSLAKLQILNINGCKEVEELPSIETLPSLGDFRSDIYYKQYNAYKIGIVDKAEG